MLKPASFDETNGVLYSIEQRTLARDLLHTLDAVAGPHLVDGGPASNSGEPSGGDNCFDIELWRLLASNAPTSTKPKDTARARDYQAWIIRVVTNDVGATVSIVVEHKRTAYPKVWERVAMDINFEVLLERSPMLAALVRIPEKPAARSAKAQRVRSSSRKDGASEAMGLLHHRYDEAQAIRAVDRRDFEDDLGRALGKDFISGNPAASAHLDSVTFARLQSGAGARMRRTLLKRTDRLERTAEATGDDTVRVGEIESELTTAAAVVDAAFEKILFSPLAFIREQKLDSILLEAFPEGSHHRLMAIDAAGVDRTGTKSAPKLRAYSQKLRGILLGYVNIACGLSKRNGVHYRIVRTIIRMAEGGAVTGRGSNMEKMEGKNASLRHTVGPMLLLIAESHPSPKPGDVGFFDNSNVKKVSKFGTLKPSERGGKGSTDQFMHNSTIGGNYAPSRPYDAMADKRVHPLQTELVTAELYSLDRPAPHSSFPAAATSLFRLQSKRAGKKPKKGKTKTKSSRAVLPNVEVALALTSGLTFVLPAPETSASAAGGSVLHSRCRSCRDVYEEEEGGGVGDDEQMLCSNCTSEQMFYLSVIAMEPPATSSPAGPKPLISLLPQQASRVVDVRMKGEKKMPALALGRRVNLERTQALEKEGRMRQEADAKAEIEAEAREDVAAVAAAEFHDFVIDDGDVGLHKLAQLCELISVTIPHFVRIVLTI